MKLAHHLVSRTVLTLAFTFGACSTGRVFTTGDSATGFSYSLPETVIKIDLPVKFWMYGTKNEAGEFQAGTDRNGYLDIDTDVGATATPIALEMDAYPAALSLVVLDQASNVTSLDKFEVSYHTTGADAAIQSSGILKSINSDMSDKTADIVKNYTDTVLQLSKLALNVFGAGVLQTTSKAAPVVLLRDRITLSMPLRMGYLAMNDELKNELGRVQANIRALPDTGKVIIDSGLLHGITALSIKGTVDGWPRNGGIDFLTKRLVAAGATSSDKIVVERNHLMLINGIVYPDARRAEFTLTIDGRLPDNQPETHKVVRFSGQVPEAGHLRIIMINPKMFGKRTITAEFARNGKLTKWGYTSPSRAEKMSAFLKEQATAVNTGGTELLTKTRQTQVDAATRRANANKLKTQIVTKEGELDLAKAALIRSKEVYDMAGEAYEAGKNTANAATLIATKNTAEQTYLTAQATVKTKESELEALKNKKEDVENGLVTP